jgi:hypothetical protein
VADFHRERLARLADAAREAHAHVAAALQARDEAIADADEHGLGMRYIARATQLQPSLVHRIIVRKTIERQADAVHALGFDPN